MLPVKYQGDDIFHGIRIRDEANNLVDLGDFTNVLVYLYTNENNILKYSYKPVTGLFNINKITSTLYYFIIESGVTAFLTPGNLVMELKVIKPNATLSDNKEDLIVKAEILQLSASKILNYSGTPSTLVYAGDTAIDISALVLNGVSVNNSNNYVLYWEVVVYFTSYRFIIYKDVAKTSIVASTNAIDKTINELAITAAGNSGISGTISVAINYTLYWAVDTYTSMGQLSYQFKLYKDPDKINLVANSAPYSNSSALTLSSAGNSGITGKVSLVAKFTLYWNVTPYQSNQFILHIYKDAAKTIEVAATLPFDTTGQKTISQISGSGITGIVTISNVIAFNFANILNTTSLGTKLGIKNIFSVVVEGDSSGIINDITLYDITGTYATQVLDSDTANKIIMNSLNLDDFTEEGDTNGLLTTISLVGVNAGNCADLTDKDSLNTITVTP